MTSPKMRRSISQNAIFGIEYQRFVLFEFGRYVAFGVDQRLLADIVFGYAVGIGARNFDVIAEYFVVADFKLVDAGALTFARFKLADPFAGVFVLSS